MMRSDVLAAAEQCVSTDRAAVYGDAEANLACIADVWSWWLGGRLETPLTPHDVAMMMSLLKAARAKSSPNHADNYIDGAGYLALAAEVA